MIRSSLAWPWSGSPEAAVPVHARYVQAFGNDTRSATLGRLLDASSAGVEEVR